MGEWPVSWEPLDICQELFLLNDPISHSGCRGTFLLKVDRELDLSLPPLYEILEICTCTYAHVDLHVHVGYPSYMHEG